MIFPSLIIIYNYTTKKWSLVKLNASQLFSQFLGAYTVELMDIISTNLENINASLDTDFWSGGQMFLGGIDADYKIPVGINGSARTNHGFPPAICRVCCTAGRVRTG